MGALGADGAIGGGVIATIERWLSRLSALWYGEIGDLGRNSAMRRMLR